MADDEGLEVAGATGLPRTAALRGSAAGCVAAMFAKMSPETWKGLMICVMYAACSTFLSMMYKAILSVWDFQCSFILLACQVSAGLGFCLVAMQVAPGSPLLQLKPFKTETFLA